MWIVFKPPDQGFWVFLFVSWLDRNIKHLIHRKTSTLSILLYLWLLSLSKTFDTMTSRSSIGRQGRWLQLMKARIPSERSKQIKILQFSCFWFSVTDIIEILAESTAVSIYENASMPISFEGEFMLSVYVWAKKIIQMENMEIMSDLASLWSVYD